MDVFEADPGYVFDRCTRLLARTNLDDRSSFLGHLDGRTAGRISEAWRLPIVDRSDREGHNRVTFVWAGSPGDERVDLLCTGTGLNHLLPMRRVGASTWFATGAHVPFGQVHYYKFMVDGRFTTDVVNPQRETLADGAVWSRFFTDYCRERLTLEPFEWRLLDRLADHILPFRTAEGQKWLRQLPDLYLLDKSVGVVNYIDKILAREEAHRRTDYALGLAVIRDLLRARNPVVAPHEQPTAAFNTLFADIAAWSAGTTLPQWDHARYGNPKAFMALLRRHTWTGAFCHPSYGGNIEAMGWRYLSDRYQSNTGDTLFDWRRAIEAPLGRDEEYRG